MTISGGEEFIAQISSEQLEDVQEGGVDIAGINGEFALFLKVPFWFGKMRRLATTAGSRARGASGSRRSH